MWSTIETIQYAPEVDASSTSYSRLPLRMSSVVPLNSGVATSAEADSTIDDVDQSQYRVFIELSEESEVKVPAVNVSVDDEKIAKTLLNIRNDVVGAYDSFSGPFGPKPIVYADWTASGRPVKKIESYLANEVMPLYGNTHTTTSITGKQSTCFRQEARQIIAESVNAKVTGKAAEDVVVFVGNGTTAAVTKLVHSLGLNIPLSPEADEKLRPIVFTSCYEHHSNLLPWRESVADVVTVAYSETTGVCLVDLERLLKQHQHRTVKIGAFSAASNVTGILTDVDAVSVLLHTHGALAFFDYATAAPYVSIDMNPTHITLAGPSTEQRQQTPLAYKDAIYFSGHKFLGGPGCPGVLVAKKRLLIPSSEAPTVVGGGTVFYVAEDHHRYMSNREEREEGGSPHVLGDVRLGLVMRLKQAISAKWIEREERRLSQDVALRLTQGHPSIVLLSRSNETAHCHLPVFSFLIRCADRFLHHQFVSVLLNDLFGIQTRGGCMCAGPFSQQLLGIDPDTSAAFETALLDKHEVLRPGYTRLSLPYWTSAEEVDYVVQGVLFVAEHGWKFLPQYRFNHKTGEWAHTSRLTRFPERKWLSHFDINSSSAGNANNGAADTLSPVQSALRSWSASSETHLFSTVRTSVAAELLKLDKAIDKMNSKKQPVASSSNAAVDAEFASFEHLRWFIRSEDASRAHFNPSPVVSESVSLRPPVSLNNDKQQLQASSSVPSLTHQVSAYAQIRGVKMKSRTGEETKLPRYLQLITDHSTGSEGRDGSIVDLLLKASHHPSTSINSGAPSAVSDKRADITADQPVSRDQPSASKVFLQSQVHVTPEVVKEEVVCTTDTADGLPSCFIQRTPAQTAVPIGNNSTTSNTSAGNGKILSGPGVTYLAHENSGSSGSTTDADGGSSNKAKKIKFKMPPQKLMKLVGNAVKEWNMIEEGDRLLLGLSGGKDSLAMLHVLLALQKRAPVKFELACATVDPQTASFDPSPLIPYVQAMGVTYHYLSEPIVELAKSKLQGDSLCAFCSRFKRGLLYSCCRTHKYNKLILAQHLDDLVESFLMSALHNGQVRTMKANYKIEAGDVSVIRPFVYVREHMTKEFSQSVGLPIINENCPACFEQPKERARVKKLLTQEESMIPGLFYNFKRALIPLMHDETYDAMNRVQDLVEANSYATKVKNTLASRQLQGASGGKAGAGNDEDDDYELPVMTEADRKTHSGDASAVGRGGEQIESSAAAAAAAAAAASDSIVESIVNAPPTCEPGSRYCAPCYELA